jgi:uncharacterized membrane-anchored protein YhcB (DUF1043 family)
MSQELIYTSAPRGLRPGNQGFCAVAATQGMSSLLMERLESLSIYPRDAASVGAVVHSHFRISLGGKVLHILSRIHKAETEYTGRTNHLAQHLVLEPQELPAGGPAWLLEQSNLWLDSWSGDPRWLAPGKRVPAGGPAAAPCRRWQQIMGDAGWGGTLIEGFVQTPDTPAYVIFDRGQELLPLFGEAVALLPPGQRWGVTFTTFYYPQLGPEAPCLWRGVLRGTAGAKRGRGSGLILDTAHPDGRPPSSPWIIAARTGMRPLPVEGAVISGGPGVGVSVPQPQPHATSSGAVARALASSSGPSSRTPAGAAHDAPTSSTQRPTAPARCWDVEPRRTERPWVRMLLAFAAGVLFSSAVAGGVGFAFYAEWEGTHTSDNDLHKKEKEALIAKWEEETARFENRVTTLTRERQKLREETSRSAEKISKLERGNRELRETIAEQKRRLHRELASSKDLEQKLSNAEKKQKAASAVVSGPNRECPEAVHFNWTEEKPMSLPHLGGAGVELRMLGESAFSWKAEGARLNAYARSQKDRELATPICFIEVDSGKGIQTGSRIVFKWKDFGEDKKSKEEKASLIRDLHRSVLEVRPSNNKKPLYFSFWKPRTWPAHTDEVCPFGLRLVDIKCSEWESVEAKDGGKKYVRRFYTVLPGVVGVRINLWEGSPTMSVAEEMKKK